jgi:hypothetical protein
MKAAAPECACGRGGLAGAVCCGDGPQHAVTLGAGLCAWTHRKTFAPTRSELIRCDCGGRR